MDTLLRAFAELAPDQQQQFLLEIPSVWKSGTSCASILTAAEARYNQQHFDPLQYLPTELVLLVFEFLDYSTMRAWSKVSKAYRSFALTNHGQHLVLSRLIGAKTIPPLPDNNLANYLRQIERRERHWNAFRLHQAIVSVTPSYTNACRLRRRLFISTVQDPFTFHTLQLLDLATDQVIQSYLDADSLRVSHVDFSVALDTVACAHFYACTVSVWSLSNGTYPKNRFTAHTERITAISLSQIPNLPWLVTASEAGVVTVWNLTTCEPLYTLLTPSLLSEITRIHVRKNESMLIIHATTCILAIPSQESLVQLTEYDLNTRDYNRFVELRKLHTECQPAAILCGLLLQDDETVSSSTESNSHILISSNRLVSATFGLRVMSIAERILISPSSRSFFLHWHQHIKLRGDPIDGTSTSTKWFAAPTTRRIGLASIEFDDDTLVISSQSRVEQHSLAYLNNNQ